MEKPEILKGVDLNKLKEWLSDMNGHGVWKPEFFESMGFSRSFIKDCIRKHDWLILNNGKRGSAYGVGEVDFTEKLACCLQADTSQGDGKIGRGSRARGYATGCLKVLDKFQSGE